PRVLPVLGEGQLSTRDAQPVSGPCRRTPAGRANRVADMAVSLRTGSAAANRISAAAEAAEPLTNWLTIAADSATFNRVVEGPAGAGRGSATSRGRAAGLGPVQEDTCGPREPGGEHGGQPTDRICRGQPDFRGSGAGRTFNQLVDYRGGLRYIQPCG